ncbi:type II toxin-antitoxin system Phd/YefM family antitoxin [Sporichthya polymorpha]|uniref:type II toxin-antitoxin system Phd/YefM family antitoxin n=1 Tax=Sporichthya polymorpha TaxID=35751 RepID=UPI000361682E|nr:type II toxin-antitoxin system Phd/YefM family antitoxin [Sporichthya polymorpha]
MTTISSREFNQDVSAAKRSATNEPVIITDRGEPSHVLLSIQEYRRLLVDRRTIVDWLSADDDIELPDVRMDLRLTAPDL